MHFSTFFLLKYNELGLTGVQKVLNGGKFAAQKTRKMQLVWWRVLQKTTASSLQCSIWNGIECWKPHNKVVITKLKIKSFWRENIAKDNCFINKAVFYFIPESLIKYALTIKFNILDKIKSISCVLKVSCRAGVHCNK